MGASVSAGPVLADDSRVAAGGGGGGSLWQPVHRWHLPSSTRLVTLGQNNPQTLSILRSHISHCCRRHVMDLQAVIVFVGGFAFCAVVGYIVSVFGAKEQASLFVVQRDRSLFVNIVNLRPTTSHRVHWVGLCS